MAFVANQSASALAALKQSTVTKAEKPMDNYFEIFMTNQFMHNYLHCVRLVSLLPCMPHMHSQFGCTFDIL
jgi:hypothetical protein